LHRLAPGWPPNPTQGGDFVGDVIDMMGGEVVLDRAGLTVSAGDSISGIDVDLHDSSELTPVVAALCALADSPSIIRGVAHVRGHETDRLAALRTELTGLGAGVEETPDGLRITPRPLHGGTFHTYADHRMVMAAAVLGLVVPGLVVEDVGPVARTMPEFTTLWRQMRPAQALAGEYGLVDLPRRRGDRQEARGHHGAEERRHEKEGRLARPGLGENRHRESPF